MVIIMEYCLDINNLTKNYPNFTLNNVSIQIPKGTIMGFIGENGAGKTTTIKSILNMVNIDSGTIFFNGHDITNSATSKDREEIGVVLDECCFHDALRVKDINLIMKNIYKNWDSTIFHSYIDQFHIPTNKTVKQFSKGNKMKLNLAVALSHHPKLLILDEATSGLDPVIRSQILDVFLDFIQDEEHTILLSSHITTDLEKICDYITFIQDGQIVFSQTKDDVLERYGIVHCTNKEAGQFSPSFVINQLTNAFNTSILINDKHAFLRQYPSAMVEDVTLEQIMLFYSGGKQSC
ncbi:ABC transporter ATP-binding protein [Anaerosporobacter faecicola]|uniref:ABC transporter ATP-binding protein n=1 Tax=Anaerosporobacter faecicola TaxID=2718714 RepID=UPI001EE5B0B5|nr:ABC transporter ATP-binding protein [Anaerosporobacter faecicola]